MIGIEGWIYTILVLMVWSGLYRPTWVFRIAENLIIGLFLAFTLYNGIQVLISRVWNPVIVAGDWLNPVLISVMFGVLSWGRFNKKTEFLGMWPLAFLTGLGSGVAIKGALDAQIIKQITIASFPTDWSGITNELIIILTTLTVMVYFTYSYQHTGVVGGIARIGRLMLMVGLGAIFGLMQMGNFAISIGNMREMSQFPFFYLVIAAALIIVIDIYRRRAGIAINWPLE